MKTQNQILHFLADFQLSQPTTTGERTFSGVAYAGGVITDHGWFNAVAFDLATTTAETPLPLLFNHSGSPIGVIETINITNQIEIAGRLFADIDATAKDIATKADRGIKWQLSVGIFPASTENLNGLQPSVINGQTFNGEITLLKQNRIREVSFVTLGADDKTAATVFNATPPTLPITQESTMTPEEAKALQGENTALKTENAQFKAEADAAKKAAREIEIKNLFTALGREYKETEAAPYLTFTAEQFAVISKELLAQKEAQKPNLPAHLFGAQATNGQDKPSEPPFNLTAIYQQMNGVKLIMAIKNEGVHSAEFLLSSEESASLDKVILISGQNLVAGSVLGKITASGKYTLHNAAATDGSEIAAAILFDSTDASAGDMPSVVVSRLAEVIDSKLIFKSGISAPNRAAAILALATQHIITRS